MKTKVDVRDKYKINNTYCAICTKKLKLSDELVVTENTGYHYKCTLEKSTQKLKKYFDKLFKEV